MKAKTLVDKCERLFPGALASLWKGLVFHPVPAFLDKAKKGHAVFPADAADVLLAMRAKGWISPVAFRPNPSQRAFLGLQYSGASMKEPHAGNAASWDWECLIEPQIDLKEYLQGVES